MEANPHVSLSIVDPGNMYRYVQIRGEAIRFDPHNGARDIDRLSMRYTGKPYPYPDGQRPEDRVSVLITPRSVSGWRG
ncbi:MAG: hypothetical protein QN168_02350 [Armatimonadota bacterium]|nr:hypothetical protein [Armatimonadota bacterium]